jgi:hypothetical protein
LASIQFILAAGGKDSSVKEVEVSLVEGIPRNFHDGDWISFGEAVAKATTDKIKQAGVGGAAVDSEVIARTVATEFSRRLMG